MADGELRWWWTDPRPGNIFRQARAVAGGVELRSPPLWRNATAVISPTGLILEHRRTSVVQLWTDPDWCFTFWGERSGTATALGLAVEDHRSAGVLRPTWAWPVRWFDGPRRGAVPLEAKGSELDRARDRVALLEAMRKLLAAHPGACDRLNDPIRCEILALSLRTWAPGPPPAWAWKRRDRVAVVESEMRRAGIGHEGGRPLPGWTPPPVAEVVESVRRRLDANVSARQLDIDDQEVQEVVARSYFQVEPWPFGALVG